MRTECIAKIKSKLRSSYFDANDQRRRNKQSMFKLPDWLDKNAEQVPLRPILSSPDTILNYRNKCEFTFGYAVEGFQSQIIPDLNLSTDDIDGDDNNDSIDIQQEENQKEEEKDDNQMVQQEENTEQNQQDNSNPLVENNETKPLPSLGFRVSSYKEGLLVASPEGCPHIPLPMVEIVKLFIEHIRQSEFKVYDQYKHSGVWRLLTVRYSERTNQMILMLCVSLKGVSQELWSQEKQILVEKLSSLKLYKSNTSSSIGEQQEDIDRISIHIKGFQLQVYDGLSVPLADHPVETLFGEDSIVEEMNGCRFKVSPQAFFQVNTTAAEILYNQVVDDLKASLTPTTTSTPTTTPTITTTTTTNEIIPQTETNETNETNTIETTTLPPTINQPLLCLDICCGTGTIGIICSKANLGNVVGIEMCPAAVENAKINAKLNGLHLLNEPSNEEKTSQAAFICSRAEVVLENILNDRRSQDSLINQVQYLARGKKLLAVVDPPREGLHIDCLRAIRSCTRIERLVYISCNPVKSLIKDCVALCGPSTKKLTGTPFKPIYGTPVDLFPMTPHCEMILVLERTQN
mmetsp:Transcript_15241/g.15993  ORF Transcript_15241/g.15993 Transcript_15241/m.15993 type:complete len:575 (-) Transcript_15241:9-1733(-)